MIVIRNVLDCIVPCCIVLNGNVLHLISLNFKDLECVAFDFIEY